MRPLSRLAVFIVLPAMFVCSSCISGTTERRAPRLMVNGKVVFIPAREGESFYFDAEAGVHMARAAGAALRTNRANLVPVDFAAARGPLRSLILEDYISPERWAGVAQTCGADYLVHCTIDRIAWVDPFDRSLPRCTFTLTYTVVNAPDATEILRTTISGAYPVNVIADGGVTVFAMGPEGLRQRAYDYMGGLLARTFYAHTISIFEAKELSQSENLAGN